MGSQRVGHDWVTFPFFLSSARESQREIHMGTRQVIYRRNHGALIRHRDCLFLSPVRKAERKEKNKQTSGSKHKSKCSADCRQISFSTTKFQVFWLNSVQEDTQSILTLLLQMLAHDGFSTGTAQRRSGNRYSRRSRRPPWGSDAHTDACRTEQLSGWIRGERATQVQGTHSSSWGLGLWVSGDEYRESKGSLSNRAVPCHKANENGYIHTPHTMWPWSRPAVTLSQHYVWTAPNPGGELEPQVIVLKATQKFQASRIGWGPYQIPETLRRLKITDFYVIWIFTHMNYQS